MTKPSREELNKILLDLIEDCYQQFKTGKYNKEDGAKAKSAINSLTLKQVKDLIGHTEVLKVGDGPSGISTVKKARNALRAELIQSAERIWS